MQNVAEIIKTKIRPILNRHQGDIDLVEITADGIVKVKLTGTCAACPGAQQTMTEVVENNLIKLCPQIRRVVLVNQVSDDLINQALKILRKDKRNQ